MIKRSNDLVFVNADCIDKGQKVLSSNKTTLKDFTRLLEAEVASLNDCIDCLEHYRLVLCDITSNYIYEHFDTTHVYL